jgi:hypothetical protein
MKFRITISVLVVICLFVNPAFVQSRSVLNGDVTIDLEVVPMQEGFVSLKGKTNLPTGTELMLSVKEKMKGGFYGQAHASINADGTFLTEVFGPKGGLQHGVYTAEVLVPSPEVQSGSVRKIIGSAGENMTGPLAKVEDLWGLKAVIVSTKKEFTLGKIQAQKQREIDAEKATSKLKYDTCKLLEQLLTFKDNADFKSWGFSTHGPYCKWLEATQTLRDANPKGVSNPIPIEVRIAPGQLVQLGFDYMRNNKDTRFTKQVLPEVMNAIDYGRYLENK